MHEQRALSQDYREQMAAQRAQAFNRGPEPREQPLWMRLGHEPPRPEYEPIPEQQPHLREPMHTYPRTTAPSYGGHPAYSVHEHRFPPSSQPPTIPVQHASNIPSTYEISMQDRQRLAQQQHEEHQRVIYGGPPPNQSYSHESPSKRLEDATRRLEEVQQQQHQAQKSFLGVGGVQEMNRKGRLSPLPQAVQGAQGQIGTPGSEVSVHSVEVVGIERLSSLTHN